MRLDGDWRNDDESGGADGESPTGRNKKRKPPLERFSNPINPKLSEREIFVRNQDEIRYGSSPSSIFPRQGCQYTFYLSANDTDPQRPHETRGSNA